jgi:hypothetical protein
MKLLWFYTANASSVYAVQSARAQRIDHILKVEIPRHAFECPVLMDCLLATSALQLEFLLLKRDHRQDKAAAIKATAIRYRARAFEGYRKAINEANTERTLPALIACSLLLAVVSSQMFREGDTKELYIVDWMVVWRGISLMIGMASPQRLQESGIVELFLRPAIDLNEAAFHVPSALLSMVSSIQPGDLDYPDDAATYYITLKYLGSLYSALITEGPGPIMTLRIVTWFTFIPESFLELARQRRPRALLILAHYLVFMKTIYPSTLWWIEGIADREITGIIHLLDHDDAWSPQLAMLRLALSVDNHLDVASLLLNDPDWQLRSDKETLSTTASLAGGHRNALDPSITPRISSSLSSSSSSPPPRVDTRGFQQDKVTLVASYPCRSPAAIDLGFL